MIEAGQQSYLAKESLSDLLSGRALGQKNLHGLYSVRNRMTDLVNPSHASGAKSANDLMIADAVSNSNSHAVTYHCDLCFGIIWC